MKKTKIKSRESGKAVIKHAPYGDQSRRMTSITRKLQIRLIRRKFGIYLFSDFLLFLLASVAFFFGLEYNRFSSLSFLQDTSRTLTTDRGVNQIWYIVRDKSGTVLLEKDVTLFNRSRNHRCFHPPAAADQSPAGLFR